MIYGRLCSRGYNAGLECCDASNGMHLTLFLLLQLFQASKNGN